MNRYYKPVWRLRKTGSVLVCANRGRMCNVCVFRLNRYKRCREDE